MLVEQRVLLGKSLARNTDETHDRAIFLEPQMLNRHGLIAGATGTGKTVTVQVMAEALSEMGIPTFIADIKGDLAGLAGEGEANEKIQERIAALKLEEFTFKAFPVEFFDVFGDQGHPLRATVSDMGPFLLARILDLSDVQTGVLNTVFHIADDSELLLYNLNDLRSMLNYVGEHNQEYTVTYGNITKQSIGAILRAIMILQDEGGELFFGEPMFDIHDFLKTKNGKGVINLLHAERLYQKPLLYSTFLLWLLSELFEELDEVGDLAKPRLVFFFDEAHLLFNDAPKSLLIKIEQTVKLIRSKGVGIFFATQNPSDIPDGVLAQLNNRIEHALRAYTPAEQRKVKIAAESFRANKNFDTAKVISELKTGEALVSCLNLEGEPNVVERTMICPPQSRIGTIDSAERERVLKLSSLAGKYEHTRNSPSAEEALAEVFTEEKVTKTHRKKAKTTLLERAATNAMGTLTRESTKNLVDSLIYGKDTSRRGSTFEKATHSAIRTVSNAAGRNLTRGLFSILKKHIGD